MSDITLAAQARLLHDPARDAHQFSIDQAMFPVEDKIEANRCMIGEL
jgi:hypothetical protein